jgi:hypothetical protein
MSNRELTLTELLDDPMTRAVMAADRVDPAALEATLSAVAHKLRLEAHQQRNCLGWSGKGWLTTLMRQEPLSDNGGRMLRASWVCRKAASADPGKALPLRKSD